MRTLIGVLFLACVSVSGAAQANDAATQKAEQHCVNSGGAVQTRIPEYGTNDNNPLVLSGKKEFCQYTKKNDGSHINVLLSTLDTKEPTLAALAYYAQVPLGSCQGNPGSCYCSQLGGTDLFGGINAAGGGWVLSTDSTDVLEACIFPDMSSIDSWGLAYHSANIIRGTDLAKVLRYKNPNQPGQKQGAKSLPFADARKVHI